VEFTLEQGREFSVIPEGEILQAELLNVKVVEKPWDDKLTGEPQKMVSFEFVITEDCPYKNQHVWGETWTSFNTGSPLYRWVKELLGQDQLEVGFKFDTDNLDGLTGRVLIGNRPKKDKNTGNVTGTHYYVEDVYRASDVPTTADMFENDEPF
jgi:hypothetical protein